MLRKVKLLQNNQFYTHPLVQHLFNCSKSRICWFSVRSLNSWNLRLSRYCSIYNFPSKCNDVWLLLAVLRVCCQFLTRSIVWTTDSTANRGSISRIPRPIGYPWSEKCRLKRPKVIQSTNKKLWPEIMHRTMRSSIRDLFVLSEPWEIDGRPNHGFDSFWIDREPFFISERPKYKSNRQTKNFGQR